MLFVVMLAIRDVVPLGHGLVTCRAVRPLADLRIETVVHMRIVRDVTVEATPVDSATAVSLLNVKLVIVAAVGASGYFLDRG